MAGGTAAAVNTPRWSGGQVSENEVKDMFIHLRQRQELQAKEPLQNGGMCLSINE